MFRRKKRKRDQGLKVMFPAITTQKADRTNPRRTGTCNTAQGASEDRPEFKKGTKWFNRYEVDKVLGSGSYGVVVRVYDSLKKRFRAIKAIKDGSEEGRRSASTEAEILYYIKEHDKKRNSNLILVNSTFEYRNMFCIVTPLYSYDLWTVLKVTGLTGLSLTLVRIFGEQVLEALDFLAGLDRQVMHCDIKPDNIVLVHPTSTRVKLIDFGIAQRPSLQNVGLYCQTRWYRSPEVVVGHKYGTQVDMWSLGIVLVELFTGKCLFPASSQRDLMKRMIRVFGLPPRDMLAKGKNTKVYFETLANDRYQFKDTKGQPRVRPMDRPLEQSIRLLRMNNGPVGTRPQFKTSKSEFAKFVDLLHQMFLYDPSKRIRPSEALSHPFIDASVDMQEYLANQKRGVSVASLQPSQQKGKAAGETPKPRQKMIGEEEVELPWVSILHGRDAFFRRDTEGAAAIARGTVTVDNKRPGTPVLKPDSWMKKKTAKSGRRVLFSSETKVVKMHSSGAPRVQLASGGSLKGSRQSQGSIPSASSASTSGSVRPSTPVPSTSSHSTRKVSKVKANVKKPQQNAFAYGTLASSASTSGSVRPSTPVPSTSSCSTRKVSKVKANMKKPQQNAFANGTQASSASTSGSVRPSTPLPSTSSGSTRKVSKVKINMQKPKQNVFANATQDNVPQKRISLQRTVPQNCVSDSTMGTVCEKKTAKNTLPAGKGKSEKFLTKEKPSSRFASVSDKTLENTSVKDTGGKSHVSFSEEVEEIRSQGNKARGDTDPETPKAPDSTLSPVLAQDLDSAEKAEKKFLPGDVFTDDEDNTNKESKDGELDSVVESLVTNLKAPLVSESLKTGECYMVIEPDYSSQREDSVSSQAGSTDTEISSLSSSEVSSIDIAVTPLASDDAMSDLDEVSDLSLGDSATPDSQFMDQKLASDSDDDNSPIQGLDQNVDSEVTSMFESEQLSDSKPESRASSEGQLTPDAGETASPISLGSEMLTPGLDDIAGSEVTSMFESEQLSDSKPASRASSEGQMTPNAGEAASPASLGQELPATGLDDTEKQTKVDDMPNSGNVGQDLTASVDGQSSAEETDNNDEMLKGKGGNPGKQGDVPEHAGIISDATVPMPETPCQIEDLPEHDTLVKDATVPVEIMGNDKADANTKFAAEIKDKGTKDIEVSEDDNDKTVSGERQQTDDKDRKESSMLNDIKELMDALGDSDLDTSASEMSFPTPVLLDMPTSGAAKGSDKPSIGGQSDASTDVPEPSYVPIFDAKPKRNLRMPVTPSPVATPTPKRRSVLALKDLDFLTSESAMSSCDWDDISLGNLTDDSDVDNNGRGSQKSVSALGGMSQVTGNVPLPSHLMGTTAKRLNTSPVNGASNSDSDSPDIEIIPPYIPFFTGVPGGSDRSDTPMLPDLWSGSESSSSSGVQMLPAYLPYYVEKPSCISVTNDTSSPENGENDPDKKSQGTRLPKLKYFISYPSSQSSDTDSKNQDQSSSGSKGAIVTIDVNGSEGPSQRVCVSVVPRNQSPFTKKSGNSTPEKKTSGLARHDTGLLDRIDQSNPPSRQSLVPVPLGEKPGIATLHIDKPTLGYDFTKKQTGNDVSVADKFGGEAPKHGNIEHDATTSASGQRSNIHTLRENHSSSSSIGEDLTDEMESVNLDSDVGNVLPPLDLPVSKISLQEELQRIDTPESNGDDTDTDGSNNSIDVTSIFLSHRRDGATQQRENLLDGIISPVTSGNDVLPPIASEGEITPGGTPQTETPPTHHHESLLESVLNIGRQSRNGVLPPLPAIGERTGRTPQRETPSPGHHGRGLLDSVLNIGRQSRNGVLPPLSAIGERTVRTPQRETPSPGHHGRGLLDSVLNIGRQSRNGVLPPLSAVGERTVRTPQRETPSPGHHGSENQSNRIDILKLDSLCQESAVSSNRPARGNAASPAMPNRGSASRRSVQKSASKTRQWGSVGNQRTDKDVPTLWRKREKERKRAESKEMSENKADQVQDDLDTDFETSLMKEVRERACRRERSARRRGTERRSQVDRHQRDERALSRLGRSPAEQNGNRFTALDSQNTGRHSARSPDIPAPSYVPNFSSRPNRSSHHRETYRHGHDNNYSLCEQSNDASTSRRRSSPSDHRSLPDGVMNIGRRSRNGVPPPLSDIGERTGRTARRERPSPDNHDGGQ